MAWKRAEASKGAQTWVRELYGREPEYWTDNLTRITLELMIEEQRQEQLARASAENKYVNTDWRLKLSKSYWRMKNFVVWL